MKKEHLIESLLNFEAHDLSIQLERDQIGGGTQLHMNSFHFFSKSIIIAHYILFEQYLNTPFVSPFHTGQIKAEFSSSSKSGLFLQKCAICRTKSAAL